MLLLVLSPLLGGLVLLLAGAWGQASLKGEVTWWQAYPEVNNVYTEYAKQYMAEHPEAKITLTLFTARAFDDKLNTAMPAGTGGDILEGWDGQLWPYISAGMIVKLPPDAAAVLENRLVWLDLAYGRRDERKSLGGAVGRVRLRAARPTPLFDGVRKEATPCRASAAMSE
mgnify:CR=1 FL=1